MVSVGLLSRPFMWPQKRVSALQVMKQWGLNIIVCFTMNWSRGFQFLHALTCLSSLCLSVPRHDQRGRIMGKEVAYWGVQLQYFSWAAFAWWSHVGVPGILCLFWWNVDEVLLELGGESRGRWSNLLIEGGECWGKKLHIEGYSGGTILLYQIFSIVLMERCWSLSYAGRKYVLCWREVV